MLAKILIVDDQILFKEQFKQHLELAKICPDQLELVYQADGQAGYDYVKSHSDIRFMVVDVHMPLMTGLEMLAKIKADFPEQLKNCEVFVMTTEADKELIANAKILGVKAWLIKPINFPSFVKHLEVRLTAAA